MGTIEDALDNVVGEIFFATLQAELLDRRQSYRMLTAAFDYIEGFYNGTRGHSRWATEAPPTTRRITVDEAAAS
jgi:hypothetical protein